MRVTFVCWFFYVCIILYVERESDIFHCNYFIFISIKERINLQMYMYIDTRVQRVCIKFHNDSVIFKIERQVFLTTMISRKK